MPEDRTTLTADASQYFDVLARAGVAADRLGGAGERVGAGFLRGDRAVRVATGNIVQGLASANSVADATLITFQSLERVFRIPIGSTIAAAAGIAGTEALRREFEKTQMAVEAVQRATRVPLSIQIGLSPEDIASRIDDVTKATDALIKRRDSFGEKAARFFAGAASGGMQTAAGRLEEQNALIEEAQQRARDLATARADAELEIAQIKARALTEDKKAQDISKAELEFTRQRAKLLEEQRTKGIAPEDFDKRFKALQITRDTAIAQADITAELAKQTELDKALNDQEAKRLAQLKGQVSAAQGATDFFTSLGSGKFLQDQARERERQKQEQFGRQQAAELSAFHEAHPELALSPNTKAILDEADRLAARVRPDMTIQELANTDFSNMLELSKYDFSGLQPLNGLTLTIK